MGGTFRELLRCGCVDFEQNRPEIDLMEVQLAKVRMRKGVVES